VLKAGDVSLLIQRQLYKAGYTAATLACLVKEDGRCYTSGYNVRPELTPLQKEGEVSHIECQEECMDIKDCRAFSYNPGTRVCIHEQQASISHAWSGSKAVYSEKSCIRGTDRSCWTEGYDYQSGLIENKEAHSVSQCLWHCLNEKDCKIFVFVKLGNGRKNSCMLKYQNKDDIKMKPLKGALMADMECLRTKGEQGYYPNMRPAQDQTPLDTINAGSRDECQARCNEHDGCKAFTLHNTACSRYSKVPSRLESAGQYLTGFKEYLQKAAGGKKTSITCPFENNLSFTKLSCPRDQVLSIEYAMYGRESRYVCLVNFVPGGHVKTMLEGDTGNTCRGDEVAATKLVREWCQGKRTCEIDLGTVQQDKHQRLINEIVPCNGVAQYLKVEYKCSLQNIGVRTLCEGGEETLVCGKPTKSLRIKRAVWGRQTDFICRKNKLDYCGTGDQYDYRGTMSRTKSGATCQRWDSHKVHEHKHFVKKSFPVLIENYCRNPDPDGEDPPKQAWCFTTDKNLRKETCPVPDCSKVPCQSDPAVTTQTIRELCEGKQSCKVRATSDAFNDPCPHIPKYLDLSFSCSEDLNTGDYDMTLPLLDPAKLESVTMMLDELPAADASGWSNLIT